MRPKPVFVQFDTNAGEAQRPIRHPKEDTLSAEDRAGKKILLFGHFGMFNSGNEGTLQATLHHLRRFLPEAEVSCVCDGPEAVAATYKIPAIPISRRIVKSWNLRNPLARLLRAVLIGIPSEFCRWIDAFRTSRGAALLVIPGTGLLTDACGLGGWGPYGVFKWVLIAKLCRCKVVFLSVGAGPIYSARGRWLVRSALSLADYRSYRDQTSLSYVAGIGVRANDDRVYPDLVFSLPEPGLPAKDAKREGRLVVGLGLMKDAGKYGTETPSDRIYQNYLEQLVVFAKWLLAGPYDISLLIGDIVDRPVTDEFKALLKMRLGAYEEKRILDSPIVSVKQIASQLAATDIVVATRFHNVLLACLLQKPVIAISFHHKCASLMNEMGLSQYCQEIAHLNADRLIGQFRDLERNADKVRPVVRERIERSRRALEEQYNVIFKGVWLK